MRGEGKPRSRVLTAMSYGEFSYAGSALIGFVVGNVIFLMLYLVDSKPGQSSVYADQLPTLAAFVIGSVASMLVVAALLNYVVGSQIMEEIALQRRTHSTSDFPVAPKDDKTERAPAVADSDSVEEQRRREMA